MTQKITLPVQGMTCNHCKMAVEKALSKVTGVSRAEVDLAGHQAFVEYDPAQVTREQLVNAVQDAGYRVEEPAPPKHGGCCC